MPSAPSAPSCKIANKSLMTVPTTVPAEAGLLNIELISTNSNTMCLRQVVLCPPLGQAENAPNDHVRTARGWECIAASGFLIPNNLRINFRPGRSIAW